MRNQQILTHRYYYYFRLMLNQPHQPVSNRIDTEIKYRPAAAVAALGFKATGNSRSGIPGNRRPPKFPAGISEILAGITGNFASFVFFPNFYC